MRKLIVTLFVLATSQMMMANPIGQEKARKIAQEFMTGNNFSSRSNTRTAASTPRQLNFKDIGMKNLYAFADETSGGFVIVADDDCVEPVLAYSETDDFYPYAMPTAMQMMLLCYEQQISNMRKTQGNSNSSTRQTTASPGREAIAPLIKTMWHGYLPLGYNCPFDQNTGRNTQVGCVALTLAQIMYYYQYPQGTTLTIPGYTTAEGYKMEALPPTMFDYSKMHLNYDHVYDGDRETIDPNDSSLVEVTKLLVYAGCALKMQYSVNGSASVFDNDTIAKYFGYDRGARYLLAGNYPHDVWEEMVYQELKAGRPVPYLAGAVGNQSHEFIIDGYDGNGYFHANLGGIGRGGNNVFYKLGVINECAGQTSQVEFSGYNVHQAGYFGFQPDKGNDAVPEVSVNYGSYALPQTDFARSSANDDFKDIVLDAEMKRYDNNGHTMDYGWGLFQNGLLKQELCSSTTSEVITSLNVSFNMGGGLADGTYQLFPIFRNHDAKEWEAYLEYLYTTDDGTPMRHYTATIDGNNLHIGVSSTEPNLEISKVEYYAAYEGEKLNARVWFTNNGTNYENELFLWIDGEMRTGVGAYVDPGMSNYIDFCTASPTIGTHNVKICSDWDGQNVVYTGTLTVTEAPKCQLEANVITDGLKNRVVYNIFNVVCTITNVGTTTFANMVDANLVVNKIDENGHFVDDFDNGYPTWHWQRDYYLYLEPGESADISFSLGKEVLMPKDYLYELRINFYNNKFTWGNHSIGDKLYEVTFTYDENESNGIAPVTLQTVDDGIFYDLQGRRVSTDNMKSGIYIRNGKKILIK